MRYNRQLGNKVMQENKTKNKHLKNETSNHYFMTCQL